MPKISIVIPVYNAEKFLVETLDSVKNQTFTDFECVIVNDGSTDKSLEIIESYIKNDSRFRIFTIPNSGCANKPIQFGVKNSIADLVMIIGHDDKIDEICLQKQYDRLIFTNSDVVILTLIGCLNELNGELYRLPLISFDKEQIVSGKKACSLTIGSWQISCNGMLFKKELYNDIPIDNYMNSDELVSRYILFRAKSVSFSDAKYIYRNHNNSISRNFSPRLFERILVDEQLEQFVSKNYGVDSYESKKIRNTRLFNYIHLHSEFTKNKTTFNKVIEKKIQLYLYNNFNLLNKQHLVKELPFHLRAFLLSYYIFKYLSIIYVSFKKMRGKSYIYK